MTSIEYVELKRILSELDEGARELICGGDSKELAHGRGIQEAVDRIDNWLRSKL